MSMRNLKPLHWVMWALVVSFFAYQFILRLWPSLMMAQIMQQFSVDATAFGFLSAIYYFSYAGMQIPMAILLDRWGPRFVVSASAIACGIATLLFTYTDQWLGAVCGRFLIGAASAAGFLGASKFVSLWFPASQYARMIGYTFTLGLLGALYGGRPVNALIDSMGGQTTATLLAVVAIVLGLLIALSVRQPSQDTSVQESLHFQDLKAIATYRPLLWLALANFLMVGALDGFADVWGVNYLTTVYRLPKAEAAGVISFIYLGMVFGGPFLAVMSERFGMHQMIIFCGLGLAGLFFLMLFGSTLLGWWSLITSFFLMGILCCYQVLVFAVGASFVPTNRLGITIAFLNCINMFGGSFFHSIIGFLMDWFWTGQWADGVRSYTEISYTAALFVIPMCAVLGGLIVLGLKWHQQQSKALVIQAL